MHMMGMGMGVFGGMFGFGGLLLLGIAGYIGYRLLHRQQRQGGGSWEAEASLEQRIYRFAAKHAGAVTVSELVVETGITAARLEKTLDNMVDERRVRLKIEDDGTSVYEFPELQRLKDE